MYFLAVALLRKIRGQPKGVGWILEPLVSISAEKRNKNPPLPVVFVNKLGDYKTSDDVEISQPIEKIKEGFFPCIFISAEALMTNTGTWEYEQFNDFFLEI